MSRFYVNGKDELANGGVDV